MSEFVIKRSTRQGIIPLICLWGGTGGGKTRSAILLARGIAGPNGKVRVVDTEAKRSGYYSDRIPGGFDRIDFDAPFTPERYVEVLDLAEKDSDVVVVDSTSHAWFGPDGVLELHEQALDKMTRGSTDWKERERLNWPAWREPKMRLKHLTNRFLGFKVPLILCFRGEEKSHMEKDEKGRNVVVTDKTTTPVFDKKFIFEAHIAMECFQKDGIGGYVRFPMPYAKTSHPDIRPILPKAEVEQLSVEHGNKLGALCNSKPSEGEPTTGSQPDDQKKLHDLKRRFFGMTKTYHHGNTDALQQWCWDESLIGLDEKLADLSVERLEKLISKTEAKLKGVPA